MAEPQIIGDIAFSEILDGIPEKTFLTDSILEADCSTDLCEDFNEYAFQKLPVPRDNFNYSTQASADANWISSDLPQIRVNAVTEEIDYDWTQSNTIEAISFDLGKDFINKERWALRFKFVLNSFTKADPSPNLPFIGLATINSSSTTMDGDGIGFQVEVRTGEPVDLNIFHRDDATTNKDLVGDQGTDVVVDIDSLIPDTFYVELRRESTTKAVCDVYSDAQFTTLLGSGTITMEDLTSDLRYILIAGRDNNGMNLLDGTIDDLELWNGGQQGDITFEDTFKQKSVTFSDDFSTDQWVDAGTAIQVNTGTEVIDWDVNDTSTNHATAFDLGTSGINNNSWTLRAKVVVDNVTAGADVNTNRLYLGLFDSDQSVDSNTTQDGLFLGLLRGSSANIIGLFHIDGAVPDGNADVAFTTVITATTYYVEIKRTSSTNVDISLFSDATYTTLIEVQSATIPATIIGLRYIKAQNRSTLTGDSTLDGTIDDVEFWNGNSTLTNWNSVGTGVVVNTNTNVINWTSVLDGNNNSIVHDLQSSLGVNADDENWTLRFKYRTDTLTAGSTRTKYFWIGLFDSDQTVDSESVQDFIGFEFFVNSTLPVGRFSLSEKNNVILTGAGTQADLTTTPSAQLGNDIYVEVKRTSATTAELTFYSDVNYTEIIESITLTIPAGIIDLRYIGLKNRTDPVNTGSMTGIINDLEFYNGVSVPRTPVHETKDLDDTFLADNWVDSASGQAEVNTTTQVIDFDFNASDTTNHQTVFDLGVGNVSDDEWTLRGKTRFSTVTLGSNNYFYVGIGDSDQTAGRSTAQDFIGLAMRGSAGGEFLYAIQADGVTVPFNGGGVEENQTWSANTNYYWEVKRISSTENCLLRY